MKISFYAWGLGKGGAERVISNLSNAFSRTDEVSIIINTKKGTEYDVNKNIRIFELDSKRTHGKIAQNIHRLSKTKELMDKINPDLILSFLPVPSFRILLIRRYIKGKIIVCERNDPEQEYKGIIKRTLMKLLYRKADGFIFQTNQQKEYFSKRIQKRSCVIENPIKEEFLHNSSDRKKENTICNVGRLHPQKNQKLLIDSFKEIVDKYPDYRLKIYGDGPLKNDLIKYIEGQGLRKKVILCGIVDNIKEEMLKSKVFVLSSDYEGMPNALIEAMALGLPCISTDCSCGGPRELITNDVDGILVECNNRKMLASSIDELLSDKEKMARLSKNAKSIRRRLNPDAIYARWRRYIEIVINKKDKQGDD
ncbi:glycosyltransferase family 4 protein [Candidatus Saccharibacteria bacterium]|nr:glycosyltransferase family 4 protein [Candidatus Saccharibacteria bacterium]